MATAFGGLAILSVRHSLAGFCAQNYAFFATHIQSLFFASLFLLALVVIAHHTNPSEASFRQHLTELSFRRHISRIDQAYVGDGAYDDSHLESHASRQPNSAKHLQDRMQVTKNLNVIEGNTLSRFHFNGHASITLRPPTHIVWSLAILSLAAISSVMDAQPQILSAKSTRIARQAQLFPAYCYLGIFGRWWLVGPLPFEGLVFGDDPECSSSGALSIRGRRSVVLQDVSAPTTVARSATQNGRERISNAKDEARSKPTRSSTPPPLPMSVTLPLHDTRSAHRLSTEVRSPLKIDRLSSGSSEKLPGTSSAPSQAAHIESLPAIADLLKELTNSQGAVSDLQSKIGNFESAALSSRSSLETELESQREQKRTEDATRAELKSRTKALDDSKRHTDSTRREAEKRLRAAQNARDTSLARIEQLSQELVDLQAEVVRDQYRLEQSVGNTEKGLSEVSADVERHKLEIKVAEDLIAVMNSRTRNLEESLAAETARLEVLRNELDVQGRDRESILSLDDEVVSRHESPQPIRETAAWPPPIISQAPSLPPMHDHEPLVPRTILRRQPTNPGDQQTSHSLSDRDRADRLKIGETHRHSNNAILQLQPDSFSIGKGYSIFNRDFASLQTSKSSFAPFGDSVDSDFVVKPRAPVDRYARSGGLLSPATFQGLEGATANMGMTDGSAPGLLNAERRDDIPLWRASAPNGRSHTLPTERQTGAEPQEILSSGLHGSLASYDLQHASFPARNLSATHERGILPPTSSRSGTGLNPDAKVFSPPRGRSLLTSSPTSALTLPVSSVHPSPSQPKSTSAVFAESLRAFAPSAAEREVLSRVLGSAANASLERLAATASVDASPSPPLRQAVPALPRSPFLHPGAPAVNVKWPPQGEGSSTLSTSTSVPSSFFPLWQPAKSAPVRTASDGASVAADLRDASGLAGSH